MNVESWKETSMQENWYLLHFSIFLYSIVITHRLENKNKLKHKKNESDFMRIKIKKMKWGNMESRKSLKISFVKTRKTLGCTMDYVCDSINAFLAIDVWLWSDIQQFFIFELEIIIGWWRLQVKIYHTVKLKNERRNF